MDLRLFTLLFLAGCGYKVPLTRTPPDAPGMSRTEIKQARADEAKMTEAGLTLPPQARPVRVDDLTIKLDERAADPFNLPPER
jgi:predicted small lipoprotein YifL